MKNKILNNAKKSEFDIFFDLMKDAFPSIERRNYKDAKKLFYEDLYNVILRKDGNNIIAFLAIWDFEDFKYIEHFAVSKNNRGYGIGTSMLKEYLKENTNLIFLEVEFPSDEISRRRIEFYKRLGFYLNDFKYLQPPLQKHHDFLPLMIMSYPRSVDEIEFINLKNKVYDKVYKLKRL